MGRFKLFIEYEGTRYSGWQVQKNARTVQGELLGSARKLFKTSDLELYGAGRTDAGVHAIEQVAHLDVRTMLGPEIIRIKMNELLPADIHLIEVDKAPVHFHARHDAVARSYLYQISRRRTAFGKKYVWWIKDKLNFKKMLDASERLTGMQDFRSFTADEPEEKSTKVLIEKIEMKEVDDLILFRITGSHFLWKQVRQIIGVIAEIGRGNLSAEDLEKFLSDHSDEPAKYTAPPSGLFLEKIYYRGDRNRPELEPLLRIKSGHSGKK